jgi:hypothetical protein
VVEVLLNGRKATGWELPAVERARQHERDQCLTLLAGVLTGDEPRPDVPRPVTDVSWEFG